MERRITFRNRAATAPSAQKAPPVTPAPPLTPDQCYFQRFSPERGKALFSLGLIGTGQHRVVRVVLQDAHAPEQRWDSADGSLGVHPSSEAGCSPDRTEIPFSIDTKRRFMLSAAGTFAGGQQLVATMELASGDLLDAPMDIRSEWSLSWQLEREENLEESDRLRDFERSRGEREGPYSK